jgi:hypothetical protein
MSLRNVGWLSTHYTELYSRGQNLFQLVSYLLGNLLFKTFKKFRIIISLLHHTICFDRHWFSSGVPEIVDETAVCFRPKFSLWGCPRLCGHVSYAVVSCAAVMTVMCYRTRWYVMKSTLQYTRVMLLFWIMSTYRFGNWLCLRHQVRTHSYSVWPVRKSWSWPPHLSRNLSLLAPAPDEGSRSNFRNTVSEDTQDAGQHPK